MRTTFSTVPVPPKTNTTTHNLGVALAAKGKRVLLIDLDSQASLTISVGLEPLEMERTIVDVYLSARRASANSANPDGVRLCYTRFDRC